MALAHDVLERWQDDDDAAKRAFMHMLLVRFGPHKERLEEAIDAYQAAQTPKALHELHMAAEPRRQELIRRLNLAPNGTAILVRMREVLLKLKRAEPDLEAVDSDFAHLFGSWFNRGFLVLKPINWSTPADILEKIIRYEAVHHIGGWDELRRRLAPEDRRCFAFFHPQLVDDPLVFVEVALTREMPARISDLLGEDRETIRPADATTAVFYSISNCQAGLRGISFGNFLIKQVVEDLRRELPGLETFVTLSPVSGFAEWLAQQRQGGDGSMLAPADREALAEIEQAMQHVVDLIDARTQLRQEWAQTSGERIGLPQDGSIALATQIREWLRHREPKQANPRIVKMRQEAERRSEQRHRAEQNRAWTPGRRSRKPIRI